MTNQMPETRLYGQYCRSWRIMDAYNVLLVFTRYMNGN